MTGIEIVEAHDPETRRDAAALVFEYLAQTATEIDKPVPANVDELPAFLRDECADLAAAYPPPGAVLLAYVDGEAAGVVGLRPQGEVKRLFVRPRHRSRGIARRLMAGVHERAADQGMAKLVLDVLPSRTRVIDFYRDLGYTDASPPAGETFPMVYLERNVEDGRP